MNQRWRSRDVVPNPRNTRKAINPRVWHYAPSAPRDGQKRNGAVAVDFMVIGKALVAIVVIVWAMMGVAACLWVGFTEVEDVSQ